LITHVDVHNDSCSLILSEIGDVNDVKRDNSGTRSTVSRSAIMILA
jgi:hypothetical protein